MSALTDLVSRAIHTRAELIARDDTDCYRLFHGVSEGRPGLAIDRYGPILLAQTWREPLIEGELAEIASAVDAILPGLTVVWNHRKKKPEQAFSHWHDPTLPNDPVGVEEGLRYDVRPRHRGIDPLLFLDFRVGRRQVRQAAQGKSVLNLFSYTCGIGVAALAGGATEVWNVDFAQSALDVGTTNAQLNDLADGRMRQVHEDVFPATRQLAGLPLKARRGQKRTWGALDPRLFDVVVLDPPRWAKTPFGAVDIVRDYPSLFKPALLCAAPNGQMLVTNNVASVDLDDWLDVLRRSATKAGRPLRDIEVLLPGCDFPSFDGRPPLKLAWLSL